MNKLHVTIVDDDSSRSIILERALKDAGYEIVDILSSKDNLLLHIDSALNRYRAARIENGRLESCLFIGPEFLLPERDWLLKLFKDDQLSNLDRKSVLTGKPVSGAKDAGKTVCACFNVGLNTLVEAIKSNKLSSPEQVGKLLHAGTNCGSCIPEIKEIIKLNLTS